MFIYLMCYAGRLAIVLELRNTKKTTYYKKENWLREW